MRTFDLDDEVGDLDLGVQQKIEIARALFRRPRILLLDEPTSTLSGRDVDWLGRLIADERAKGATIVFISHRLREVRAFCDTMTVLRNGRHIATASVSAYADDEVIAHDCRPRAVARLPAAPRLATARWDRKCWAPSVIATAGKLNNASFSLRAGEVLGVAGLQGMGQLDLFLACFGMADSPPAAFASTGDADRLTSPTRRGARRYRHQPGAGGPQDRGAVRSSSRQA